MLVPQSTSPIRTVYRLDVNEYNEYNEYNGAQSLQLVIEYWESV